MKLWAGLLLLSLPTSAWADAGDVQLGAAAAWQVPRGGRLGLAGELGLSDFAALRLEFDAAFSLLGWQGLAAAGPTFSWDVATWVPAVSLAVGLGSVQRQLALRLLARAEMRRYVSTHWWFSVGAAEECLRHEGWQCGPLIGVSVFRML